MQQPVEDSETSSSDDDVPPYRASAPPAASMTASVPDVSAAKPRPKTLKRSSVVSLVDDDLNHHFSGDTPSHATRSTGLPSMEALSSAMQRAPAFIPGYVKQRQQQELENRITRQPPVRWVKEPSQERGWRPVSDSMSSVTGSRCDDAPSHEADSLSAIASVPSASFCTVDSTMSRAMTPTTAFATKTAGPKRGGPTVASWAQQSASTTALLHASVQRSPYVGTSPRQRGQGSRGQGTRRVDARKPPLTFAERQLKGTLLKLTRGGSPPSVGRGASGGQVDHANHVATSCSEESAAAHLAVCSRCRSKAAKEAAREADMYITSLVGRLEAPAGLTPMKQRGSPKRATPPPRPSTGMTPAFPPTAPMKFTAGSDSQVASPIALMPVSRTAIAQLQRSDTIRRLLNRSSGESKAMLTPSSLPASSRDEGSASSSSLLAIAPDAMPSPEREQVVHDIEVFEDWQTAKLVRQRKQLERLRQQQSLASMDNATVAHHDEDSGGGGSAARDDGGGEDKATGPDDASDLDEELELRTDVVKERKPAVAPASASQPTQLKTWRTRGRNAVEAIQLARLEAHERHGEGRSDGSTPNTGGPSQAPIDTTAPLSPGLNTVAGQQHNQLMSLPNISFRTRELVTPGDVSAPTVAELFHNMTHRDREDLFISAAGGFSFDLTKEKFRSMVNRVLAPRLYASAALALATGGSHITQMGDVVGGGTPNGEGLSVSVTATTAPAAAHAGGTAGRHHVSDDHMVVLLNAFDVNRGGTINYLEYLTVLCNAILTPRQLCFLDAIFDRLADEGARTALGYLPGSPMPTPAADHHHQHHGGSYQSPRNGNEPTASGSSPPGNKAPGNKAIRPLDVLQKQHITLPAVRRAVFRALGKSLLFPHPVEDGFCELVAACFADLGARDAADRQKFKLLVFCDDDAMDQLDRCLS